MTATLFKAPSALKNRLTRELLVAGTRQLAESFLLLHELFHISCGHVSWFIARSTAPAALSYDELNLGLSDAASMRSGGAALRAARYREVEADNSALQWLVSSPLPVPWRKLVGGQLGRRIDPRVPILELQGELRRLAFAAVLNAVWLMTAALERGRHTAGAASAAREGTTVKWQRTTSHPYPMARLLASTATLLQQYAALTRTRVDADGFRSQTLSSRSAQAAREFVNDILRHALIADWVAPLDSPRGAVLQLHPPAIVREFGHLLLGKSATTPAGKQLETLQKMQGADPNVCTLSLPATRCQESRVRCMRFRLWRPAENLDAFAAALALN